jgi:hypothetical protein
MAEPFFVGLRMPPTARLRALAGTRVGVGALAVDGQAETVTDPLVGADLHLALDVVRDLATEVTLDMRAMSQPCLCL